MNSNEKLSRTEYAILLVLDTNRYLNRSQVLIRLVKDVGVQYVGGVLGKLYKKGLVVRRDNTDGKGYSYKIRNKT